MSALLGPWDGMSVRPTGKGKGAKKSDAETGTQGGDGNPFDVWPGEPGGIVGTDATGTARIADLNAAQDWAVVAGSKPWPEGAWITYGPEHKAAHWDGTRFKTGKAPA